MCRALLIFGALLMTACSRASAPASTSPSSTPETPTATSTAARATVPAQTRETAVVEAAISNAALATRTNTAALAPTLAPTTGPIIYVALPGADIVPITLQQSTCEQLASADDATRAQQIPQLVTRGEANLVPLNTTGRVVTVGKNCTEIAVLDGAFQGRSVWVPRTAVQTTRAAQQALPPSLTKPVATSVPQPGTSRASPTSGPSIEYQLASLQRGGQVSPTDPLIQRFATVLTSLQSKCSDSRLEIGNEAVRVWQLLQQRGVPGATLLGLMVDADAALPAGVYGPGRLARCSEVFALVGYLEETTGGQ